MKKKKFIITKTPLRVSFFGGGTDFENFYKKFNGKVISTSINKYIYVTIKSQNNFFNEKYRLNYSKTERVKKIDYIRNDIIRECLKYTNVKQRLYISTVADIPDSTGLGSSSAFTVGLLKGLYELMGKKKTNKELAEIASFIEIKILKNPIGKQDQYACALGGCNVIKFYKNNNVKIRKIKNIRFKNYLKDCVLIWTGKYKKSKSILNDQNRRIHYNISYLKKMLDITNSAEKKIFRDTFYEEEFIKYLKDNWEQKKKLSNKITNKSVNTILNKFNNYKYGIKLLGAGGGGFILVFGKNYQKIIKKSNLSFFKIKSEDFGSKIVYQE